MEEALDAMIRRGGRAPSQGAAIARPGMEGVVPVCPGAPMPLRGLSGSPAWDEKADASADELVKEDAAVTEAPPA